ncbi:hypothetical protein QVZ41_10355 [Wenyingzhuangia sp. chi5]|uniref:SPOR domain-containing protein n=1 Tax=Wenyingzhuangia gilva TaxID=3057677 RepID=A0ABT8VTF0_9FLAO|nr:hypothetical protein [Wenyingzhuangia sp. chi5]MDO3695246.1 hypothetical protein [Wenyingzhuangia sp. chi5]
MHNKIIILFSLTISMFTTTLIYSQDHKSSLDYFIEKKRNYNKTSKNGYSVLLYNGNEEQALITYNTFEEEFKDIKIKLTYVSPDWKVITKAYSTKIEAERIYLIIKEKYPNAKIL